MKTKNIKLIVDSTFYLTQEVIRKYNVTVIPLNIIIDGQVYQDEVDTTVAEVMEKIEAGSKVSTSQPAPFLFTEAFNAALAEGYEHVLCMTMSSTLSGTYQSALLGAKDANGEVTVFDTLSTSIGSEIMFDVVASKIDAGADFAEIMAALEQLRPTVEIAMNMKHLDFLARSGRISYLKGRISDLLRVKPIIFYSGGQVRINAKFRTDRMLAKSIIGDIEANFKQAPRGAQKFIYVSHLRGEQRIKLLCEMIKEKFTSVQLKLRDGITAVIANNLGYAGFGVAWGYLL